MHIHSTRSLGARQSRPRPYRRLANVLAVVALAALTAATFVACDDGPPQPQQPDDPDVTWQWEVNIPQPDFFSQGWG